MAVIKQEGPFKRKHLRKCSPTARPYWPIVRLSNDYARLELDSECITDRHLWAGAHFLSHCRRCVFPVECKFLANEELSFARRNSTGTVPQTRCETASSQAWK